MKLPRISVQTIMALVVVVAADGLACRAVATRPGGMAGRTDLVLLNGLPMVNLLAISLALWIRRGKVLGSFWPGFTAFGLIALVGSSVWIEPILGWWEVALTRSGLVAWVGQSEVRMLVAELGILPIALILPQLVVASVGGGLARKIASRPTDPPGVPSRRLRLASLVAMAAVVVIPASGIEAYLGRAVDRKIARIPVNSEAVVVVKQLPIIKAALPLTNPPVFRQEDVPQVGLGTRVKVKADDGASIIQGMQIGLGKETFVGDFRMVQVTPLEGEFAGKSRWLPRYALKASRSSGFAR